MSRSKPVHHLSQVAQSSEADGWVDGLTSLSENSPATALLDEMDNQKLSEEVNTHC